MTVIDILTAGLMLIIISITAITVLGVIIIFGSWFFEFVFKILEKFEVEE